ncbi:MAG: hypothetical protein OIF56_09170 [Cohaesibacter sp.]|nr:hypothetical protein [Cohaesibacter sp.]MCV6601820.1 hypothetical protein [Cohaesibacter sp.]
MTSSALAPLATGRLAWPSAPAWKQHFAAFALSASVFCSGFVINEPSPYEFAMVALIGIWAFIDLKINRYILPLVGLMVLFIAGGVFSITQSSIIDHEPLYMAVSAFLAFTSIFFAAIISQKPVHYTTRIYKAYVAAAVVTAILGIIGYFGALPGFEIFTRNARAMGAFQDPNVFGPYLVLPFIFMMVSILKNPPSKALILLPIFGILAIGILLSFSRAAWGLAVFSTLGASLLFLVTTQSTKIRARILVYLLIGAGLMALGLVVALSIDEVRELLLQRFTLRQNYDNTRFATHAAGFAAAWTHPLGFGALEFGPLFGQDPHNIYLKSLVAYGWLGLIAYLGMIITTFLVAFPLLFRTRPWQLLLQCAFVVWLGHILIAQVIDIDHWRHVYMLFGFIWGFIGAEYLTRRKERATSQSPDLLSTYAQRPISAIVPSHHADRSASPRILTF